LPTFTGGAAERAQDALLLEERESIEIQHRQDLLLLQRQCIPAAGNDRKVRGLNLLTPCPAKFRELLEALEELRGHLAAGEFGDRPLTLTWEIYGSSAATDVNQQLLDLLLKAREKLKKGEAADAEQRKALELTGDEIERVKGERDIWELENPVEPQTKREKALVPDGQAWQQTLKMLEHLDRAIDRKTRIIMDLVWRAESNKPSPGESGPDSVAPVSSPADFGAEDNAATEDRRGRAPDNAC